MKLSINLHQTFCENTQRQSGAKNRLVYFRRNRRVNKLGKMETDEEEEEEDEKDELRNKKLTDNIKIHFLSLKLYVNVHSN